MHIKYCVPYVVSLLVLASVAGNVGAGAMPTSAVVNESEAIQNTMGRSIISESSRNPPSPPLMWTEDFSTYLITVPMNPDGDPTSFMVDWGDGTNTGWLGPYAPGIIVTISHVWSAEGNYQLLVTAKTIDGSVTGTYGLSWFSPFKFFSPIVGFVSVPYIMTIYYEGEIYFLFDWGDGTMSDWLGPQDPCIAGKTWDVPGVYGLRWKAKDQYGAETPWSDPVMVTIEPYGSQPPGSIDGPSWGLVNVNYTFTVTTTDKWSYCFCEWGDGTMTGWIGPFESSQTFNITHAWSERGVYTIRMKFKDSMGVESDWINHLITIYGLKAALISGRYENMSSSGGFITIHALNLHLIVFFLPPIVMHGTSGENVTFYVAHVKTWVLTPGFIMGLIRIVI